MRFVLALLAVFQFLIVPARADGVDDLFARHVAAGSYREGGEQILGLSSADPLKAAGAAGTLQFAAAIERLGQSLYRFGLGPPQSREMIMLPILRFPVPENANPERIDYAAFRTILETLVTDLDAAEATLTRVGDADLKLPVDLAAVRIDFNADGKKDIGENISAILAGFAPPGTPFNADAAMRVNFDTADIYWVRGYSRFISAFAQFLLAHDFHETFDKTFHLMFPKAGLETGDKLFQNRTKQPYADGEVGDLIAFIHLMNWPVTDPARLKDVRQRLVGMTSLSASSWAAARRETDNDLEWLPNAKQGGAFTGAPISDEIIDGWLVVMAEFQSVLEGRKLLPHWRFDRGLNAKRMFEEQKRFDLVLLVAGTDAVNYLEDGPISDSITWNNIMGVFRGNFLGYALWFN